MRTLYLKDTPECIATAGGIIRGGGLVAIPTETVYGLAANALSKAAVEGIFRAKGRPQDNPLIVHIADIGALTPDIAVMSDKARILAREFWPGPLTMVLPRGGSLPDITTAGLDSVGVRLPSHPVARAVIRAAGVPVAAPSANRSGSPSPTTAKHCADDLSGRVDAILDGGHSRLGLESTVLSLLEGRPLLLRPGAVTPEQISYALGEPVELAPSILRPLESGEAAPSPGMKYRHYAPKAHVTLIKGGFEAFLSFLRSAPPGSGALVFEGEENSLGMPAVAYGRSDSPESQAAGLFDALRALDEMGLEMVYARAPVEFGIGLAVYNRLLRACGFEVIVLE